MKPIKSKMNILIVLNMRHGIRFGGNASNPCPPVELLTSHPNGYGSHPGCFRIIGPTHGVNKAYKTPLA